MQFVEGMSFDTTASNSGVNTGAAVLLQQKIGRKLMLLPCRHHIYEIVLRSIFETKMTTTSGPEVLIFERFAKEWSNLNHDLFKSGITDESIFSKLSQTEIEDIKIFCCYQLTKFQIREDYKEFLQLVLIFIEADHFEFHKPGATSHARWMAKAIYSLKIFLFRDQFSLTNRELNGLRDVCISLIKLYVKPWFECTKAINAPLQDFDFVKNVVKYSENDSAISAAVVKKMTNHLWYLSEENIGLAFFDSRVSFEEKRKMVQMLQSKEPVIKLINSRNHNSLADFKNYSLSDFVSEKTKNFFNRFGLSTAFLELDPSTWGMAFDFEEGWTFCKELLVVNDTAERGVKFMKDYNKILTNDEEHKQLLLQVVEAYRKKYSSYKKSELLNN